MTSTKQRQQAGVNGGAETDNDVDFTATKIGRSLGGAGTRQDVRVVIDSDQMTPTGTAVSKRNALASCDQQPRATEVANHLERNRFPARSGTAEK
ncbi:uncharacterized protein [Dermacentor albipictus]|uniref:uncharacterized protein isoform X3 n=1 Tax=Dermacentor albipictus TaxID=60249 RepID=UPI0038FC15C6